MCGVSGFGWNGGRCGGGWDGQVGEDDAEAQWLEVGEDVFPQVRIVGEAVDEEDCGFGGVDWFGGGGVVVGICQGAGGGEGFLCVALHCCGAGSGVIFVLM